MLAALERGPCFVSFSGGRDSSAVLAAATQPHDVAGLPAPVPVTIRAAHEPHSHESEWQELVVAHLGLDDWIRIQIDDELDAVGPYARRALERHGLLWPFNAHFHLPMLEQAVGGTLLTGIGGRRAVGRLAAPRLAPRRRALGLRRSRCGVRCCAAASRSTIRGCAGGRDARPAQRGAAEAAAHPRTLVRRMGPGARMRSIATGTAALDLMAGDAGASICHPLLGRAVWGAVAAAAPRAGFAGREDALRLVAGASLPAESSRAGPRPVRSRVLPRPRACLRPRLDGPRCAGGDGRRRSVVPALVRRDAPIRTR